MEVARDWNQSKLPLVYLVYAESTQMRPLLLLRWLLLFLLLPAARASSKPEQPLLIPLEPLGVPAAQPKMLAAGATLYTLNFVDDTHLLLTYFTRGLLTRLPDADVNDFDGLVAGVLLELPTGKVLARTEWRVRDRNTYLWPVGHGHFLFRVRSHLAMLDPLGNLASGEAFRATLFANLPRRIGYITTSPGGDLLAIETLPPLKHATVGQAAVAFDDEKPDKPAVEIYFYRLSLEDGHLEHKAAGAVAANNLIAIPANASGFLSSVKESAAVYNFDYISHDGKKLELSPFDTTCAPHPHWISRSDFVAFGCQVSGGKPMLAGFNLKGENAWINVLGGQQLPPSIVPSPESGRFALERVLISATATNLENLVPEETLGQEITVFQSYDGRQLQKVNASPIQRAGQNFDLSPNGLALAVVQNGNIAVYKVPPLNGKDQAALKLARTMEPPPSLGRIHLNSVPASARAEARSAEPASGSSAEALPGATVSPEPPPTPGVERSNVVGDVPVGRRKPPTLYDPEHPPQPGDARPRN